jgi:hypothetical protein
MRSIFLRSAAREGVPLLFSAYDDPKFIAGAFHGSRRQLLEAGGTFIVLAVSTALAGRRKLAAFAIGTIALIELLRFAAPLRMSFSLEDIESSMPGSHRSYPHRTRILNTIMPNSAMITGALDIDGYDPGITRRYAEFVSFAQYDDPGHVSQDPSMEIHPRFALLRLEHDVRLKDDSVVTTPAGEPAFPRVFFAHRYEILVGRDAVLHRLFSDTFDPRQSVILESEPEPRPQPLSDSVDTAEIMEESTDHLVIHAKVEEPALMVLTDAYHPFWRAEAMTGSAQSAYEVMPADYVLRAIPLERGEHRIRLEYWIPGWGAAAALSIVSLMSFLGSLLFWWLQKKRMHRAHVPEDS